MVVVASEKICDGRIFSRHARGHLGHVYKLIYTYEFMSVPFDAFIGTYIYIDTYIGLRNQRPKKKMGTATMEGDDEAEGTQTS